MIATILFFLLVYITGVLYKNMSASEPKSPAYMPIVLSLAAWGILVLFVFSAIYFVELIIHLSMAGAIILTSIIMVAEFAYKYLWTASEAGSMDVLLRRFFYLLTFRAKPRKTDDIFVELKELKMKRAAEEEKKTANRERSSETDHQKYFGL